jgi:hypothetical protein
MHDPHLLYGNLSNDDVGFVFVVNPDETGFWGGQTFYVEEDEELQKVFDADSWIWLMLINSKVVNW